MPGPLIRAKDLRVVYRRTGGISMALNGFTARIRPGITGLVGPNGAGKTTLLRTLVGCLDPATGHFDIDGLSPSSYRESRGIGFLPENPPLPGFLTVEEFLAGLPGSEPPLGKAGVNGRSTFLSEDLLCMQINALSMGQKRRVALAAALWGDPEIVLLDEPTNGIDPQGLRELRRTLLGLRARRKFVIASSHHLDELLRVADVLLFVREGRNVGKWVRDDTSGVLPTAEEIVDSFFPEVPNA